MSCRSKASISQPNSTLKLFFLLSLVLCVGHWIACAWGLTARLEESNRDDVREARFNAREHSGALDGLDDDARDDQWLGDDDFDSAPGSWAEVRDPAVMPSRQDLASLFTTNKEPTAKRSCVEAWFADHPWVRDNHWSRYALALEFSFYTITSVGYGDIPIVTVTEVSRRSQDDVLRKEFVT